jgi:hypothetical protein
MQALDHAVHAQGMGGSGDESAIPRLRGRKGGLRSRPSLRGHGPPDETLAFGACVSESGSLSSAASIESFGLTALLSGAPRSPFAL